MFRDNNEFKKSTAFKAVKKRIKTKLNRSILREKNESILLFLLFIEIHLIFAVLRCFEQRKKGFIVVIF